MPRRAVLIKNFKGDDYDKQSNNEMVRRFP